MKIVSLTSKNVKRLKAVHIKPDGSLVIVGGRNGQGKSSVLDSIAMALGGKDELCRVPVRRGAKRAEVTCDLGDLIVRRTFTEDGGGQLVVENKEGARFNSPQSRLDDLVGRLSFDPLEFSRMKPDKQAETLRSLVGLDFKELDDERAAIFAQRTDVNRDGKNLRARYDALPGRHEDAPEAPVPSSQVLAELDRAQQENEKNAAQRRRVADLGVGVTGHENVLKQCQDDRDRIQGEIERLQVKLREAEAAITQCKERLEEATRLKADAQARADALVDVDLDPIKAKLASLEDTNRKVRENALNAQLLAELEAKRAESTALTEKIEAIDARKQEAIAKAQFPIAGLGFDADGGVTFGGLPFDQASAAEQLRVSVAIGLALNPKLRVLLIRDGSLLDAESLKLISEMAEQQDAQLWLERVEDGGATVVIEDGSVVGAPEPAEEPAA